ncbi:MAG: hypothetical protein HY347_12275 [candidate division NC10 bacterium]|nr:hypothetical protein [candidate division NC10 bacterium]
MGEGMVNQSEGMSLKTKGRVILGAEEVTMTMRREELLKLVRQLPDDDYE